ncbi:MAG: adenylate/guanylate cyclase domain-containing protein [Hyphomicrobiales bacterium]|nr:adenylate/guanylate cyclase domain-containing protein [Hyphomicrobiales bacterium]
MTDSIRTKPPAAPVTKPSWHPDPLLDWLMVEGWNVSSTNRLLAEVCRRLTSDGMPVWRMRCLIRTLHPQVIGNSYTWHPDQEMAEEFSAPLEILETPAYLNNPFARIVEGAGRIRRKLTDSDSKFDFPVLEQLRDEGGTDYVALPVPFSDGTINAISLTSDEPRGFADGDLHRLGDILPALSRLLEVQAMRRTAAILLDTYLGKRTGERVLKGLVKRGDGVDIHAVIWFCDMRDSTRLAESMSREAFLAILNDFFDCLAGAVVDNGGEVLSFIGDAALAIFPTDKTVDAEGSCCTAPVACGQALAAARDAQARMESLNRLRGDRGEPPIDFGLGLHIGDLIYGNIGIPGRLQFTVIGAAANEAARIEGLCKKLGHRILLSAEFAHCTEGKLLSLGQHQLAGVGAPMEVLALLPEDGSADSQARQ